MGFKDEVLARYSISSDSLHKKIEKMVERDTKKLPKGKGFNDQMREAAKSLLNITDPSLSIFKINDKMEALMAKHASTNPELSKILFELRRQKAEVQKTFDEKASRKCDELRAEGVKILQEALKTEK